MGFRRAIDHAIVAGVSGDRCEADVACVDMTGPRLDATGQLGRLLFAPLIGALAYFVACAPTEGTGSATPGTGGAGAAGQAGTGGSTSPVGSGGASGSAGSPGGGGSQGPGGSTGGVVGIGGAAGTAGNTGGVGAGGAGAGGRGGTTGGRGGATTTGGVGGTAATGAGSGGAGANAGSGAVGAAATICWRTGGVGAATRGLTGSGFGRTCGFSTTGWSVIRLTMMGIASDSAERAGSNWSSAAMAAACKATTTANPA